MKKMIFIRMAVLTLGITLMTFGVLNGELQEILRKAVRICLECIGIG
ncbi:MAG: hypothetical protein FWD34_00465 [Oscillospiraceae bacterium]|nr:hypothetical protein [Oscillospiraceae bacterium]